MGKAPETIKLEVEPLWAPALRQAIVPMHVHVAVDVDAEDD